MTDGFCRRSTQAAESLSQASRGDALRKAYLYRWRTAALPDEAGRVAREFHRDDSRRTPGLAFRCRRRCVASLGSSAESAAAQLLVGQEKSQCGPKGVRIGFSP